jgi:diaminohydroxyphosphoribosylaminopyrimidine deaminase/5-amino-6-(5-phosphoribosylamino)uracil reductase
MSTRNSAAQDVKIMSAANALAMRGLGDVGQNPTVGCIITNSTESGASVVIGRGRTGTGGRPHAEAVALRQAGASAVGASAYVTLEPCAHHGETPPCADALVDAGISRAVIAMEDPDPRVAGKGLSQLRDAGIEVVCGVGEAAAAEINAGFVSRIKNSRPLVTFKTATTLDGRIAAQNGASKWITGASARRAGHIARAQHDAIIVGASTATIDDPSLTCRIQGLETRSPVRVVADGRLRLPLTAQIVRTANQTPTWIFALKGVEKARRRAFEDCGVTLLEIGADEDGLLDMRVALEELAKRGVNRLLVEGGGRLASSLFQAQLVDRILWFRAPSIMGGDGVAAVASIGASDPNRTPRFDLLSSRAVGRDIMETYRIAH